MALGGGGFVETIEPEGDGASGAPSIPLVATAGERRLSSAKPWQKMRKCEENKDVPVFLFLLGPSVASGSSFVYIVTSH